MQKFDTPAPISAVLDVPAGRVRLVAGDRADTTVEVLPADPAKSRDVKAAEQFDVTCADGVLRIAAAEARHRVLGNSGSVEVAFHLPAGSHVDAKVAAAELRGAGRLGDVTVEGQQATVEPDEAGSARVTVLAGDVSIGRLAGPAEISTQKGDLRIGEAVRGAVTLDTRHGAISVGAAPGVSASLDAGTAHGRVHNALKNADGAAAELTVHATSGYGDITARSL